jgi:hypothetical protein
MYCESTLCTQSQTVYIASLLNPVQFVQVQPVYLATVPSDVIIVPDLPFSNSTTSIPMNILTGSNSENEDNKSLSTAMEAEKENIDTNNEAKTVERPRPALNKRSLKIRKFKTYVPKVPPKAEMVLKSWFVENFNDPYPMQKEKIILARESGLTVNQVNNWFQNVRKRKEERPCKFSQALQKVLLNENEE